MIITIDGPSISGKTSIARMLAQRLQVDYISSGLLFRGLAYVLITHFGYHESQLAEAKENDIADAISMCTYRYCPQEGEQLWVHGTNVKQVLAQEKIGKCASLMGTNAHVRAALASWQHKLAGNTNCVIEGRDAGSVIFPHAAFKFFLTASVQTRASRWQENQKNIGREISFEQARLEIEQRDERDSTRALAPLRIPERAIIIDSSDLSQEQVLEKILYHIKKGGI